jgi:hypothetical protein
MNNNIQNNKFIAPMDSSMRLNELKKRTTNTSASGSIKKVNANEANSALRRIRSSGYITPAKLQNKFIS